MLKYLLVHSRTFSHSSLLSRGLNGINKRKPAREQQCSGGRRRTPTILQRGITSKHPSSLDGSRLKASLPGCRGSATNRRLAVQLPAGIGAGAELFVSTRSRLAIREQQQQRLPAGIPRDTPDGRETHVAVPLGIQPSGPAAPGRDAGDVRVVPDDALGVPHRERVGARADARRRRRPQPRRHPEAADQGHGGAREGGGAARGRAREEGQLRRRGGRRPRGVRHDPRGGGLARRPLSPRERADAYLAVAQRDWFGGRGLTASLRNTAELLRLLHARRRGPGSSSGDEAAVRKLVDLVHRTSEGGPGAQLRALESEFGFAPLEIADANVQSLDVGADTLWLVLAEAS